MSTRLGARVRRALPALLGLGAIVTVAFLINAVGIRIAGDADHWTQWMHRHVNYFRVWRLLLYAGTAWGWWWMRRRLLAREPAPETRARLLRLELAAVTALALLEGSTWLR
ncbi:hypothetical protein DIE11_17235 [Burkholderia sp. Bp9012]|uniref:hypothetical protein n=1 Tax=Burkholderia sp. Bp9012 TaxID=2184562 RepID=UPI000F5B47F5|nr:hypothetical protein [Burkholderia sp. Bp9012]RQR79144.1 hypothetical protein DIE11_17235 [Burkholderia sp. Bp9012]